MALASLAEFGALYGVTKQAVAKWKAKGFLVVTDGKIAVEASRKRLNESGVNPSTEASTPASTAAPPPTASSPPDIDRLMEDADAFIKDVLAGRYATFADAERIKENALALKHVLDGRQKAGALVEIETAEKVLFEQFRSLRDSWMNWPARVGPLIAADLGAEADEVTEALTRHVQKHLAELGEPEAEFGDGA